MAAKCGCSFGASVPADPWEAEPGCATVVNEVSWLEAFISGFLRGGCGVGGQARPQLVLGQFRRFDDGTFSGLEPGSQKTLYQGGKRGPVRELGGYLVHEANVQAQVLVCSHALSIGIFARVRKQLVRGSENSSHRVTMGSMKDL